MASSSIVSKSAVARVGRALSLALAFALGAVMFGTSSAPEVEHVADHAGDVWTCAMHPSVQAHEPGSCPICGMDLIPVNGPEVRSYRGDGVVLSARARALSRLRTTRVGRQPGAVSEVRLLGRVEPDETTRKNVTTWIGGRIDRLHVNVTGERVRVGQVIATLYSPEVYGAHQDLLAARRQVERLSGSAEASQVAAGAALEAGRKRLRLLGVSSKELTAMEAADAPTRAVAIRSPFTGTVIERVATEGSYVKTGAPLYRVADLRKLWVQLDAYESDLPRLAVGQAVVVAVDGQPGEGFEGRVAFIDPTIDAVRRTARVRVEVANSDGRLRPGMFAEAIVASEGAVGAEVPLVIPASAPLFTGKRSLVYVEVYEGERVAYEPRTVRLGPRLGVSYPVVAGLSEGERVVSRGAFALDADLQIRGGASMMSVDDDGGQGLGSGQVVRLTSTERSVVAPVVTAYLEIQVGLAADDHGGAVLAAERLEVARVAVEGQLDEGAHEVWRELSSRLEAHAGRVALSEHIEGARAGFEPLSAAVEALLVSFGNPLEEEVHVAFCPMAMGSQGARWVQQGDTVRNAYFGASMPECGELRQEVAPGTYLTPLDAAGTTP